jgi:two-component system, OmpR family, sensor kinase
LRRALEAERSFTANSAHELRTPIAAALAQTQRLLKAIPHGPTQEHARAIETALRKLSRLSEKLLQLARAEGGGLLAESPQNLVQVLHLVLDDFGRNPAIAKRLNVDVPLECSLWSQIDPDAFAILARNLVENALKYSPAASIVRITLTIDNRFSVANECPVIPPEILSQLTRRFDRGVTLTRGSGLGLAIVETIANGVDAQLELFSPIPGQLDGFEATVHLPTANNP